MGLTGLALTLSLACTPTYWLKKAETSEETRFAKEAVDLLMHHDVDGLMQRLTPQFQNGHTRQTLDVMVREIPQGEAGQPMLVGYQYFVFGSSREATVSLQYPFPDSFLLAQARVVSTDGRYSLGGLHVQRLPESLERINSFHLRGKSFRHYALLTAALLVVLFILSVLMSCIRTPIPRRKWAWVLFVILGVGKIALNWTTGEIGISPVALQLFGVAMVTAGPYAPWMLSVSFPLGALWFLWRRPSFLAASRAVRTDAAEQEIRVPDAPSPDPGPTVNS